MTYRTVSQQPTQTFVDRHLLIEKIQFFDRTRKHAHTIGKSSDPCLHRKIKGEFHYIVSSELLTTFRNVHTLHSKIMQVENEIMIFFL